MADLVREIMIDATPDTIWPFLTEADRHVEWEGTKAEIDPRPGGVYRVLVAGELPVRRVSSWRWCRRNGWCSPSAGSRRATRSRRVRPPWRSRCTPRAPRPACASSTAACPTNAVEQHTQGWTHYLDRLALRAAGGDPGPDARTGGDD